jgi:hypothetical protein
MIVNIASAVLSIGLALGGMTVATDDAAAPTVDPSSTSSVSSDPNAIVASDCDPSKDTTCKTAYNDFWAKDAYETFKATVSDMPEQDIKDAFTATYYGTYSSAPEWGDGYAVVPSDKYDGVFHVFVVVPGNPVDSTVTDAADSAAGE